MLTPKGVEDEFRRQGDEVVVINLSEIYKELEVIPTDMPLQHLLNIIKNERYKEITRQVKHDCVVFTVIGKLDDDQS